LTQLPRSKLIKRYQAIALDLNIDASMLSRCAENGLIVTKFSIRDLGRQAP